MKINKKMFKHGGSLAVVIPSEFTQYLESEEVTLEIMLDKDNIPSLIIKPTNELDTIEEDPLFAIFIQAIYKHAMENPEMLSDGSEIWNDRVKQLIEGVEIEEE